jgi:hypothetical protein
MATTPITVVHRERDTTERTIRGRSNTATTTMTKNMKRRMKAIKMGHTNMGAIKMGPITIKLETQPIPRNPTNLKT